MARKIEFAEREYYHIFNRGVDKRNIFDDKYDLDRFFKSMQEFNRVEPIGSIYENRFNKNKIELGHGVSKLVDFICYCLNPNHFHFILEQVSEKGIEKFMHRLLGYSKYYNHKYKRSGVLFQGPFKAVHINSNEQLLHTSVYVNLNNQVHKLGNGVSKSSWREYAGLEKEEICKKDIILGQFKNFKEYEEFSRSSLEWIKNNKEEAQFLIE
ncbi:MAG: hypothetical protein EXS47_02160 [Candidatus Zambryskibacteria bacterium]|nr:hypothetical protein [Candidatus Zambryskibacteria bacterium]